MPQLPLKKTKHSGVTDLRKFIIQWNNLYPWDYLWRLKYKVSFGSPTHLAMSFIAMKFDLREEQLYNNELVKRLNKQREKPLSAADQRRLLIPAKTTKAELEVSYEEFENLDLSKFNDPQPKAK